MEEFFSSIFSDYHLVFTCFLVVFCVAVAICTPDDTSLAIVLVVVSIALIWLFLSNPIKPLDDVIKQEVQSKYSVQVDEISKESKGLYKLKVTGEDGATKELYAYKDSDGNIALLEDANIQKEK